MSTTKTPLKPAPKPNRIPLPNKNTNYNYDQTYIANELRRMITVLLDNDDVFSKAQLFTIMGYSSSKFYKLKAKFPNSPTIAELYKKVDEVLEGRLVYRGMQGKSIPMCIFLLKNYYHYTDQYQQQIDTSISFKVNRGNRTILPSVATTVPAKGAPKHST